MTARTSGRHGDGKTALTVPCYVSERWLRFEQREQFEVLDEDLIQIDVMTLDDEGGPYKLCELVVARGDLLRAVAAYGDPPFRTTPVRKQETAPEPRAPRPRRKSDSAASPQTSLPDQ